MPPGPWFGFAQYAQIAVFGLFVSVMEKSVRKKGKAAGGVSLPGKIISQISLFFRERYSIFHGDMVY